MQAKVSLADTIQQLTRTFAGFAHASGISPGPSVFQATLHMDNKPSCRIEAIQFVCRQPDTPLTSSQKQNITAALAQGTDDTACLYFRGPPEHWLGTLKTLVAPTGTLLVCGKICTALQKHLSRVAAASPLGLWLEGFCGYFCF